MLEATRQQLNEVTETNERRAESINILKVKSDALVAENAELFSKNKELEKEVGLLQPKPDMKVGEERTVVLKKILKDN